MSHYRVAVITKNGDVQKALAPFDESIRVAPYIYKTKQEIIDNLRADYRAAAQKAAESIDSNWLDTLKEDYDWTSDETLYQSYRDLEASDVFGCPQFDDEGNQLSTYNPDAKWDWYNIGGRYDGYILTKEGEMVSEAKVSEIDFDNQLSEEEEAEIVDHWNEAEKEAAEGDDTLLKELKIDFDSKEDELAYHRKFNTYAILVEGKDGEKGEWIEPGRMGWFGLSSATDESVENYKRKVAEVLKSLDPEDIVTIVDCHI